MLIATVPTALLPLFSHTVALQIIPCGQLIRGKHEPHSGVDLQCTRTSQKWRAPCYSPTEMALRDHSGGNSPGAKLQAEHLTAHFSLNYESTLIHVLCCA